MLSTLCEILFLDNSRPLHRQLLSLLRPLPPPAAAAMGRALAARVAELAAEALPAGWEAADPGPLGALGAQGAPVQQLAVAGSGRSPLGQALTSLLGVASLRDALAPSAAPAVACVALGIKAALSGSGGGGGGGGSGGADGAAGASAGGGAPAAHISPAEMEDIQDAGALYTPILPFERCYFFAFLASACFCDFCLRLLAWQGVPICCASITTCLRRPVRARNWRHLKAFFPACLLSSLSAVSALYYMLTGYRQQLAEGGPAGRAAALLAADALLAALRVG